MTTTRAWRARTVGRLLLMPLYAAPVALGAGLLTFALPWQIKVVLGQPHTGITPLAALAAASLIAWRVTRKGRPSAPPAVAFGAVIASVAGAYAIAFGALMIAFNGFMESTPNPHANLFGAALIAIPFVLSITAFAIWNAAANRPEGTVVRDGSTERAPSK